MGIAGLHKALSFVTKKTNVRHYGGKAVAVDTSSWLHKSVYSIAAKYVESIERDQIEPSCVETSARYIAARCMELLGPFQLGTIYLVMDGKRCPLKADTNQDRERKRLDNLHQARQYVQRGQRLQAEEKYKACIKVKERFAAAVLKSVQSKFARNDRVQLIWSPYEADSQLAKLCVDGVADAVITEDSDVLLYSATSHVPFPILFKLDRGTGSCDQISMDWLLGHGLTGSKKSSRQGQPPALEVLFRNLASRESRRPGFGVRLFVQGCILAGSDYSPNQLNGIGLVNAFKAVRDNAHRNNDVRFQKVLATLPKKATAGIDLKAYEVILSKSEAVFYHHVVLGVNGETSPFLKLAFVDETTGTASNEDESNQEKPTDKTGSTQFPSMSRYCNDLSFLGSWQGGDAYTAAAPAVQQQPDVVNTEQQVLKPKPKAQIQPTPQPTMSDMRKPLRLFNNRAPQSVVANPYKAAQKRKFGEGPGLGKAINPFAHLKHDPKTTPKHDDGLHKYLKNTRDTRFVKRRFEPPKPATASNDAPAESSRGSLFSFLSLSKSGDATPNDTQRSIVSSQTPSQPIRVTPEIGSDPSDSLFDYGQNGNCQLDGISSCENSPLPRSVLEPPHRIAKGDFTNYTYTSENEDKADDDKSECSSQVCEVTEMRSSHFFQPIRKTSLPWNNTAKDVGEGSKYQTENVRTSSDVIDLTDETPALEPAHKTAIPEATGALLRKMEPRRVTMESTSSKNILKTNQSNGTPKRCKKVASFSSPADDSDGCIDSPEPTPERNIQRRGLPVRKLYGSQPKRKLPGALESAFQRQSQLASNSNPFKIPGTCSQTVKPRSSYGLLRRKKSAATTTTPMFTPPPSSQPKRSKYFSSTKKNLFNQLKVHINHEDDDF